MFFKHRQIYDENNLFCQIILVVDLYLVKEVVDWLHFTAFSQYVQKAESFILWRSDPAAIPTVLSKWKCLLLVTRHSSLVIRHFELTYWKKKVRWMNYIHARMYICILYGR